MNSKRKPLKSLLASLAIVVDNVCPVAVRNSRKIFALIINFDSEESLILVYESIHLTPWLVPASPLCITAGHGLADRQRR